MALLFLNGGGMRGGPLNHQLQDAPLVGRATSAPRYRFYSVGDRFPAMDEAETDGRAVVGEVYDISLEVLREHLVPAEPPELEIGLIELADGASCLATVLRKPYQGDDDLVDISDIGDWRRYRGWA